MSLLNCFYDDYYIMNKVTVDDPDGGWATTWTPGELVQMGLDDPTQTQRLIADAQSVEVIQNAVFHVDAPIAQGTYLQRVSDSDTVYVVQTNPVNAPRVAGIQMKKAEVRKTRLPT